jgi:hypothetical protein
VDVDVDVDPEVEDIVELSLTDGFISSPKL